MSRFLENDVEDAALDWLESPGWLIARGFDIAWYTRGRTSGRRNLYMPLSQQEFEAILADDTKTIAQDLAWGEDEDDSPVRGFRVSVVSATGYPLFVVGRYNPMAGTLSYALIYRGTGRIYALDLGADHHNPDCNRIGEKHKHRWTETFRDKHAYVPEDITEPWDRPVEVWKQFCTEARIHHTGRMEPPAV